MSIRFAGSRCVDERRRRRLAQEAEPDSSPERRPAPRARSAHHTRVDGPAPAQQYASPVEAVVRPQLWVNLALSLLGIAISGGSIWLGLHVDAAAPALAASLGLTNGLLGRALVSFHFLMAAQLGLVILWYRARSRKDFRGQYKLWSWVCPSWLLLALASAIDGHELIRQLVLPNLSAGFWHAETLCWLAPTAIVVLTTTRFLLHDMKEDRWGAAFVVLSALGAGVGAATLLFGPMTAINEQTLVLISQSSLNTWSLAALLSMLFHARYVLHVTNEPPRSGNPGRIMAFLWQMAPKFPRRRRSAGTESDSGEKADRTPARVDPTPGSDDGEAPKQNRSASPKRKPSPRPDVAADVPPESERVATEETEPSARTREDDRQSQVPERVPESESNSEPNERTVAPTDDNDSAETMEGLSKKERRKLRKQRRQEQQRRGRASGL